MDKARFNQLLKNPSSVGEDEIDELEDIRKEYPYFQAVLPIVTIAKRKNGSKEEFNASIASTAVHTIDRKHLKQLITSAQPSQKEKVEAENASDLPKTIEHPEPAREPKVKATDLAATKNKEQSDRKTDTKNIKKPQPIVIENIDLEHDHLSEDFFKSFYKEIDQLQKSKKEYLEALEKIEGTTSKTSRKKPTSKSTAAKNSPKKTSSKSKKSSASDKTTLKTKKTSTSGKDKATAKKGGKKSSSSSKKSSSTKSTASKKKQSDESEDLIDEISKREEKKIRDAAKKEQLVIIEKFINSEPKIKKNAISDQERKEAIEDLSSRSTQLHEDVVSETLAKLMINQKRFEKAIDIYKKLIWKFPQKKAYFADQIKELKKQL